MNLDRLRQPAPAWLLLTLAVAPHVLDEALNDFLSFYNPFIAKPAND